MIHAARNFFPNLYFLLNISIIGINMKIAVLLCKKNEIYIMQIPYNKSFFFFNKKKYSGKRAVANAKL